MHGDRPRMGPLVKRSCLGRWEQTNQTAGCLCHHCFVLHLCATWSNVGTMEFSVLGGDKGSVGTFEAHFLAVIPLHGMIESKPIGSMYAIYGNIYHQYTPNVSIYTIHGSVMGNKRDGWNVIVVGWTPGIKHGNRISFGNELAKDPQLDTEFHGFPQKSIRGISQIPSGHQTWHAFTRPYLVPWFPKLVAGSTYLVRRFPSLPRFQ